MGSTARICNLCGWEDPLWKSGTPPEIKPQRKEQQPPVASFGRFYQCPYCKHKFLLDKPPADPKSIRCPNPACFGLFNGEQNEVPPEGSTEEIPQNTAPNIPPQPVAKPETSSLKIQEREKLKEKISSEVYTTSIETSRDRKHFRREQNTVSAPAPQVVKVKPVKANEVQQTVARRSFNWGKTGGITGIVLVVLLAASGIFVAFSKMSESPSTPTQQSQNSAQTTTSIVGITPTPSQSQTTPQPTQTNAPIKITGLNAAPKDTSAVITWTTDQPSISVVLWGNTWQCDYPPKIDNNPVTSHTVNLSGLSPSTPYYYKVQTTTQVAAPDPTQAPQSFTTLPPPDTTAPVISNIDTQNISDIAASIVWKTNKQASGIVEYGTSTSYGQKLNENNGLVTDHIVKISGLSASTVYHFRITSTDAAGNVAPSPDYTFTTKEAIVTGYSEGSRAPDFTLNELTTQKPVTLSSLRGSKVMITFWYLD